MNIVEQIRNLELPDDISLSYNAGVRDCKQAVIQMLLGPQARLIVLDFEATCGGDIPRNDMEVIEIGALCYNLFTETIESTFQMFVKPVKHPVLTDFCKELTNIKQNDVDTANTFYEVLRDLNQWAKSTNAATWGSWGEYDKHQLRKELARIETVSQLPEKHINLKEVWAKLHKGVKPGLGSATRHFGLTFEGEQHRALVDCIAIANIIGADQVFKNKLISICGE